MMGQEMTQEDHDLMRKVALRLGWEEDDIQGKINEAVQLAEDARTALRDNRPNEVLVEFQLALTTKAAEFHCAKEIFHGKVKDFRIVEKILDDITCKIGLAMRFRRLN